MVPGSILTAIEPTESKPNPPLSRRLENGNSRERTLRRLLEETTNRRVRARARAWHIQAQDLDELFVYTLAYLYQAVDKWVPVGSSANDIERTFGAWHWRIVRAAARKWLRERLAQEPGCISVIGLEDTLQLLADPRLDMDDVPERLIERAVHPVVAAESPPKHDPEIVRLGAVLRPYLKFGDKGSRFLAIDAMLAQGWPRKNGIDLALAIPYLNVRATESNGHERLCLRIAPGPGARDGGLLRTLVTELQVAGYQPTRADITELLRRMRIQQVQHQQIQYGTGPGTVTPWERMDAWIGKCPPYGDHQALICWYELFYDIYRLAASKVMPLNQLVQSGILTMYPNSGRA